MMVQFIDDHRDQYGVELICAVLPIAPATCHRRHAEHVDLLRRCARAKSDDEWRVEIRRVWTEEQQVYGPRKVWLELPRQGFAIARCTVERLMAEMGLRGAVRGSAWIDVPPHLSSTSV